MSDKKPHIALRILKVIAWILLALVILIIAARLSLKTNVVNEFAKNKAVEIANENLNGSLQIETLRGDLWKEITAYNINIIQDDTLLSIDTLNASYNFLSLLSGSFTVHQLNISQLQAHISEMENEQFNVQNIIKEDTTEAESEGTSFGFEVESIKLNNSTAKVYSPSYLPDSTVSLQNINASASLEMKDEISASLSSLTFHLQEGRLPQPVAIKTAGTYDDEEITLQELLVESGRSALSLFGNANLQDSTLNAEATAEPISLADIQPYIDNELPNENFQVKIEASGSIEDLNISINVNGEGFDSLLLTADVSMQDEPELHNMGLNVQNVRLAHFTDNSVDAEIGELRASLEGVLSSDIENADITWGFSTSQIRYQEYNIENFFGSGTLIHGEVLAQVQLKDGTDEVIIYPQINDVFAEKPDWQIKAGMNNVNPGKWSQNPEMEGSVSFNAFIEGQGLQLSEEAWTFSIQQQPLSEIKDIPIREQSQNFSREFTADTNSIAGFNITDFRINGSVNEDSLSVEAFIRQMDNRINFEVGIANFSGDEPEFHYKLTATDFNTAEIPAYEELITAINLRVEGSGTNFDPEKMVMESSVSIDSSYINNAPIDQLEFQLNLNEGVIIVPEGDIESQMISGSFSIFKKLQSELDSEDELVVDLNLKDLQPLAAMFGINILNAEGPIRGSVRQNEDEIPEFNGSIELADIRYDTLFVAENISGDVQAGIHPDNSYNFGLDVEISAPTISGVTLQDLEIASKGTAYPDSVNGNFRLNLQSVDAGEITQMGNYSVNLNTLNSSVTWEVLNFQTPARLLMLDSPFHLSYHNETISTDTLRLISESNAYLNLAVPVLDSLNQQAWIEGQDFDFGIIQEMLFRERFVDGILQGEISVSRTPDSLQAVGEFQISELNYLDTEIDVFSLDFNIADERLSADGSIHINGEEKIAGVLDVPFVLEDPATLEDSFFEEPVEGSLTIKPLQLSRFRNILEEFDITGTDGILSFTGSLNGTAGVPYFEGRINLENPTLSGIKIDSAFAEFSYNHLEKNIFTLAEIRARGQQAASIYSDLPISVDFRTFEVNTPGEDDSLTINLDTRNFNISVFNDFVNSDYISGLRGVLNADVNIQGTKNNLVPDGYIRLEGARANVPIAGIELRDIKSEINFTQNGLQLRQFSMNSGGGNFSADGNITLQGIEPTDMNINAQARQFKLANTDVYNLTIDMQSRLSGPPNRPKASGSLTVRNGFIYLQDFGERSVETVELEGEEEQTTFSLYDSLSIEMQFNIDRNFFVRNRRYLDLEVELQGQLDAQKETNGELQLFGSLTGERGYARPLGKLFELEEADFTFSGPLENPNLFIRTSYVPQTSQKEGSPIVLFYIIEGTAQEPEFRFESDPQMEQQDIIAYTLFGRPFYALDSWQQVISGGGTGSSPTDLLVDVLLDEVEALATRELGIDVVQIDNTRSGSDAVTSIKTGWYLNRRTFFSVVNEISTNPKTLFILEYLLTENLDLILTQGDDNRQGVDLRWQYEY